MTDPTNEGREQKLDHATMPTGILRGVRQLGGLEGRIAPAPESQPSESPYVKEPLFSRKVLIGWAAGALVVWLIFTFIAPIVIESVKSGVLASIEQPALNNAAKTVIRTRNGLTITRTARGVTISRNTPSATAPTKPVAVPAPVKPVPAPVKPVPAPLKPVPQVSERK